MPKLDVSDAFDPDFLDRMVRRRRSQTVGSNGRAVDTEARLAIYGVPANADGDTLARGSDSARVTATISITTRSELRIAGEDADADIVEWDGRAYTVIALKDYGTFGSGFYSAVCQVIAPAG